MLESSAQPTLALNILIFINHFANGYFSWFNMLNSHYHEIRPGPKVLKLEYSLKLKIMSNDWLFADMCPQATNHCALS